MEAALNDRLQVMDRLLAAGADTAAVDEVRRHPFQPVSCLSVFSCHIAVISVTYYCE